MTNRENVTQVPSICDLLDFTPTQTLNADQNIKISTHFLFSLMIPRPEVKRTFYANSQDPGFIKRKI